MKLKIKYCIFLIVLISNTSWIQLKAQDDTPYTTSAFFEAPLIGRSYSSPGKGNGTPFLYENWLKGYVVLISGDTVKNKLFKLDCFKNEFVWMSDGKSMISLDHHLLAGFGLFPDENSVPRRFEKASMKLPLYSDTVVRYLEILTLGSFNLYCYRKVGTEYQSAVGGNGGLYQVNNYSPEPVYFIQGKNLPVKQVKVTRKSLLNVYPEYTAQIKKILKESHLRGFKTEFQLVSAIALINSKIVLP